MTKRKWTMVASIAAGLLIAGSALAQLPGVKRTELQKQDLSAAGREAVVVRADFEPGAGIPRHTHPGEEISVVLEGEITVEIDGKPAQKLKAGDTYFIPAGAVHAAKSTGKGKTSVVATYVVEKGKPLVTMVPAK